MTNISEVLAKEILSILKVRKRWSMLFRALVLIIFAYIAYSFFNQKAPSATTTKPHTALIKINGVIGEDGVNSSDNLAESLHAAFSSKYAKGIILRINSPGGSPVTADYIFNEIRRLSKLHPEKKIYAVCSEICASAAYYIAAATHEVYANPVSLIGSIGVVFDSFGFVDAMHNLGVERRMITSGKYKGYLDPFSPLAPEQTRKLQSMLDEIHQQFINKVKLGRDKKLSEQSDIFSGLLWTGNQSKQLGLIDDFASTGYVAREIVKQKDLIDYTVKREYWEIMCERIGMSLMQSLKMFSLR